VDDLLSEKEQIDQIRSWWSEYGAYVIGGIVIGAGLLFGINQYQAKQLAAQHAASSAYEALLIQIVDGDLDAAETTSVEIASAYADTTYVGQAGLAMARLYMDKNRDQDAADALERVVNGNADDELKHVARLRLARIYLYQDRPQDAVDLVASEENSAFAAAYGEILGDAYTALGRIAEAQDAYQKVLLDPLSEGTVDQQLVQWKSLDLPEIEAPLESGAATDVATETDLAEPEAAAVVEADEPDTEGNE
jgi:predicted negative regulator of RcsB-dependent stress response